jgi:AraC-like DNA-binding protein
VATSSIWVSTDALSGCVEVARDKGFDIVPYLRRHGIDPGLADSSHGLLSYQAIGACLEDVAASEGCEDFGFELGKFQKPLQFGIISQVLQFAPDVGTAIRIFLKYRDLYSQSSYWGLSIEHDVARLRRQELGAGARRSGQIVMLSVTRGFEAIRSMMGPEWSPLAVYLSIEPTPYVAALRRYFGAPVFFSASFDEIAFDAADLRQSIPTGNDAILSALTQYFDRLMPEIGKKGAIAAQVQKLMRLELENGGMTLGRVASHFAMHPRSLQRALVSEGTSFRELAQETRLAVARQMIETSRAQLSDVAEAAGYRHLSSLSRAYKRSRGIAPSRDR